VNKRTGGKPNASAQEAPQGERERPAHEIRIGRIRATIWRNQSDQHGTWYSVSITRSFKQGEQWKSATSLGKDDLLVAAEVSRLAFHWITRQLGGNASDTGNESPGSDEEIPI
jgi:hypothetical protein